MYKQQAVLWGVLLLLNSCVGVSKHNSTESYWRQNLHEELLPFLSDSYASTFNIQVLIMQLLPYILQIQNSYVGIANNVTQGCMDDTISIIGGVLASSINWQKKLLDACGKPAAGILQGASHWAGDYEGCLKIKSPFGAGNISEHNPLIHGQYCSVKISFPKGEFMKRIPESLLPIFGKQLAGMSLIWDICTTQRCSAPELKTLFLPMFSVIGKALNVSLTSVVCKKPPNLLKHNEAIGALVFLVVYCLLLLVGTVYDVCFNMDIRETLDIFPKSSRKAFTLHAASNNYSFSLSEFPPPAPSAYTRKEEIKEESAMSNGIQLYASMGNLSSSSSTAVVEAAAAVVAGYDGESLEEEEGGSAAQQQPNWRKVAAAVAPVVHPPQPPPLPPPEVASPSPSPSASASSVKERAVDNVYDGFSSNILEEPGHHANVTATARAAAAARRRSSEMYEVIDRTDVLPSNTNYSTKVAMEPEFSFNRHSSGIREILGSFLLAFSLKRNATNILNCQHPVEMLSSLNGIRFLSMVWIMLAQTYVLGMNDEVKNPMNAIPIAQRFTFQAVFSATLSVDTFFLLSSTLLTYSFIDNFYTRGKVGVKNIFKLYLLRYLRLTPYYAVIILFLTCMMPYLFEGPFNDLSLETPCREKWWSNLLYINNIYKLEEMCMSHTWYLANDMQFYIVAPVVLSLIAVLPSVGFLVVTLLFCAYIATATVLWQKHLDGQLITLDDIYTKPWTRMSPFLIGILLGYFLRLKHRKRSMSKIFLSVGWFTVLCLSVGICYVKYMVMKAEDPTVWSNAQTTSYELLSRPVWALLVSWVIVICASGNGGIVTDILAWKAFIPLSRLTYGAYLLHPIIMILAKRLNMVTIYLSTPTIMYTFIGHTVLSYAVSFITTIMFDSPVRMIVKVFTNRK